MLPGSVDKMSVDKLIAMAEEMDARGEGEDYIESLFIATGKALKVAREQLALMADGEGPDADVYVQMSKAALAEINRIAREACPE